MGAPIAEFKLLPISKKLGKTGDDARVHIYYPIMFKLSFSFKNGRFVTLPVRLDTGTEFSSVTYDKAEQAGLPRESNDDLAVRTSSGGYDTYVFPVKLRIEGLPGTFAGDVARLPKSRPQTMREWSRKAVGKWFRGFFRWCSATNSKDAPTKDGQADAGLLALHDLIAHFDFSVSYMRIKPGDVKAYVVRIYRRGDLKT